MLTPSDTGPVLITGCSTGVGHTAAKRFCGAGFATFASARDPSALGDLRAIGCRALTLDVTDEAMRRDAIAAIENEFGAVGILVNNAGYGQYGPLEEITLDALRLQFETNVFGGLRLAQLALPAMRKKGFGRIVNVSSIAGRVSVLGGGPYHATKFTIEALTDALRPEVEPFGIDVVNVLPGPIATHFEATLLKGIPDTGPDSPYAYFKFRLAQRMRDFLDAGHFDVLSADDVAKVIVKAATAKRPHTRYNVGVVAKLGYIGRALTPDRVVDFMTRRSVPVVKK